MATKIYRMCDNCKHEELVTHTEERPDGWWEGELPAKVGRDGGLSGLLCDGCVSGIQSALVLRTKGTRSAQDRVVTPPDHT